MDRRRVCEPANESVMDREGFEQLVSAWLDHPQRNDLRDRIDAACAEDPQLARLLRQYTGLEHLLRDAAAHSLPVAWDRLKDRIAARVHRVSNAGSAEARLDAELGTLPEIETHVDWQAFHRKVSRAVELSVRPGRTTHLTPWRAATAAGFLAAAAALVLMLSFPFPHVPVPPAVEPTGAEGHVAVRVLPPLGASPAPGARTSLVRVMVTADAEWEAARAQERPSAVTLAETVPEVYFMLEPLEGASVMASAYEAGSH